MQIKINLNDLDLENFSKNLNEIYQKQISLESLKQKLTKNYHLILIYNNNDKDLIGSCLFKINDNLFNEKVMDIIELFCVNNNDLVIDILIKYLLELKIKNNYHEISYSCLTNNKIFQKKLSKHKFIIKKYLFSYH